MNRVENNKAAVLAAIKANSDSLSSASEELRNDKEVVLVAVN
jgi:hypothetical protein